MLTETARIALAYGVGILWVAGILAAGTL